MPQKEENLETANRYRKKLATAVSLAPSASIISHFHFSSRKINTYKKYYAKTSKKPENVDKEWLYAGKIFVSRKIKYGNYFVNYIINK